MGLGLDPGSPWQTGPDPCFTPTPKAWRKPRTPAAQWPVHTLDENPISPSHLTFPRPCETQREAHTDTRGPGGWGVGVRGGGLNESGSVLQDQQGWRSGQDTEMCSMLLSCTRNNAEDVKLVCRLCAWKSPSPSGSSAPDTAASHRSQSGPAAPDCARSALLVAGRLPPPAGPGTALRRERHRL